MALKEEFARSGAWLFRWRSYLPLLFLPLFVHAMSEFSNRSLDDSLGGRWEVFCILVAFAGLLVRVLVVGQAPHRTSGRNTFGGQVADELNTTGIYSVVRHPLYLGNFLSWLAIAMFTQSYLVVLVAVLTFALYYERIMFAEEKFLREKFRGDFDKWADRTPAFIPALRRWKKSAVPFSWRLAAEREYSGMFAIVVTFTLLHLIRVWFERHWIRLELPWIVFLGVGTAAYLWLRTTKKQTRSRSAAGRF